MKNTSSKTIIIIIAAIFILVSLSACSDGGGNGWNTDAGQRILKTAGSDNWVSETFGCLVDASTSQNVQAAANCATNP